MIPKPEKLGKRSYFESPDGPCAIGYLFRYTGITPEFKCCDTDAVDELADILKVPAPDLTELMCLSDIDEREPSDVQFFIDWCQRHNLELSADA